MKIDSWKIKKLMAEKGMTQAELGVAAGLCRQAVSTIIARGSCSLTSGGKLANALGVDLDEIAKER